MSLFIDNTIKKIPHYPKAMMYGLEEGWTRLASNENPYPPSRKTLSRILDALLDINRYPGGEENLKRSIAEFYKVRPDQVVLGDGSDELIEMILRALKYKEKSKVIISNPSFPFYAIASAIYGYEVEKVPLVDMKIDLPSIKKAIDKRTRVIFLNNPLNPTGTAFEEESFRIFCHDLPSDILIVVDEAYAEFSENPKFPDTFSYIGNHQVLVLRTFSKAYALAGLRVGYGVGEAPLVSYLERTRQPFSVNELALIGAKAALEDRGYLAKILMNNRKGKEFLHKALQGLSLECVPTEANFILFKIGDQAESTVKRLFEEKILVRWMGAYTLPGYVRVSIGTPEENTRFIETLSRILKNGK
ncbi:MAG: histidinol-phosphate transaminase [Syntrophobacterales bacterium]|jgi:histidinol-phosphate aminotransferase|nr:histidinol-phosphate transaminase [Syntrophobacterales bacterium]